MSSSVRIGILSSIIAAALVYVALEWHPFGSATASAEQAETIPNITFAAPPETTPIESTEPRISEPAGTASDLPDPDEQNNVDIYRRYSRSVVNVASRVYSQNIFNQVIPADGFGSGVVIDDEGHILTNYHVIQDANAELTVTLADKSRYTASLVGADPNNDLALIKVDAPSIEWIPLPMGTTRGLQVGHKVLAIGNPFGLERTMTTGIVSSLGRSIEAPVPNRIIEGVIQTDAAINQGNSGGPLLNTRGELIGINTAILSGATGIGFAIPVDTVRRVTTDLLTYGRVRRAYLGITFYRWTVSDIVSGLAGVDFGTDAGLLINDVMPGGSADQAGLLAPTQQFLYRGLLIPVGGDILVELDDRQMRSITDLSAALERRRPGDVVPVKIVRNGEEMTLEVELQDEPVSR